MIELGLPNAKVWQELLQLGYAHAGWRERERARGRAFPAALQRAGMMRSEQNRFTPPRGGFGVRAVCAAAVLGLTAGGLPARSAESVIGEQRSFVWHSENQSPAELPASITELYLVLYNTGQLRLRRVRDGIGQTVESILREHDLLFGPYFPRELDSLLCDLNPLLCERLRATVEPGVLDDPTSHVGGYAATQGTWINAPGDTLWVPDIELETYEEFGFGWKNSGQTIEEILEHRGVTCAGYSASCLEAVRRLNRSNPAAFEIDYEGRVILPSLGVSATVHLDHGQADSDQPQPDFSIPQAEHYQERIKGKEHQEDEAYEALYGKLVASGAGEMELSLDSEPHFATQRTLFELIHHPALQAAWAPELAWDESAVVVFDDWVDQNHCDIGDNVLVKFLASAAPATPTPVAPDLCGEQEVADPFRHHGTHVVALLAAALNSKGIGGLLAPQARIFTYEINRSRMSVESYRETLSHQIVDSFIDVTPRTYNFSWSYVNTLGGQDKIKNAIRLLGSEAVVVVAAGNQGMDFGAGDCTTLPACFHELRHVITVVGLDRDKDNPGLWGQSNRGAFFHVGAIAENVLSATRDGRHGTLSGTSQAAPQVSATVAYLWAELAASVDLQQVTPERVKNRVIYTSDYIPALKDKVMGGRLNMHNALDIGRTAVTTAAGEELRGQFLTLTQQDSTTPSDTVVFRNGSQTEAFAFHDIKRMIRMPGSGTWVVFHESPQDGGKLVRREGLVFLSSSQQLSLETGAGPVSLRLGDITDYTANF